MPGKVRRRDLLLEDGGPRNGSKVKIHGRVLQHYEKVLRLGVAASAVVQYTTTRRAAKFSLPKSDGEGRSCDHFFHFWVLSHGGGRTESNTLTSSVGLRAPLTAALGRLRADSDYVRETCRVWSPGVACMSVFKPERGFFRRMKMRAQGQAPPALAGGAGEATAGRV